MAFGKDDKQETGSTTSFTSQPGIKEILGTAGKLFNSGTAFAPDTTSHVTPFATQTISGLQGIQNTAKQAIPLFQDNLGRIQATVNDGGLNSLQDQQAARLQGLYGQGGGTGLNTLQANAYKALQPTANGLNKEQQAALNLIKPIASGGSLNGNPYIDEVIRRTSEDIGNASNLAASAAGRYGSGAHQGVTQDAVGDVSSKLRYQDYDAERARMDAAINNLFGFGTQGNAQRTAAIGAQGALGTQGEAQRRDALSSLFDIGKLQRDNVLAGTKQLSDAYDLRRQPYTDQLGVGKAFETKNQQVLDDAARVFDERQAGLKAPVEWLTNLANALRGGTTTSTNTQTTPNNTVGKALGGALSGFDIFGGPLGGIFGGLAGAFS